MTPILPLNTRILRWLAILLPVAFWAAILLLRALLFGEPLNRGDIFSLIAIGIGSAIFSFWIFGIVDERDAETQRRARQLTALHDAAVALTTETDLATVLHKVVDLSRGLVGAQYAALGVLEPDGELLDQFISIGITPEQRALMGPLPRGHGLLGVLIRQGKALRVPDIAKHPLSVGFPLHHPPMRTLLGVPVRSKGRIIGDLYMTDKRDDAGRVVPFSAQDEQVLEMFATQAAIAIENAQLYRQQQQLAVLQERERIGMDLHDGIIQSIYAIGLTLEAGEMQIETKPQDAATRVHQAISGLNDVIRDIRNYILDLRPERFQGRDLPGGLEELAREFRANTFLTITVDAAPLPPNLLTPEQTVEILHISQEALTNIRKHARARAASLTLTFADHALDLIIQDDGIGIPAPATSPTPQGGNGLPNMRERAHAIGGTLTITGAPNTGTRVALHLPLPDSLLTSVDHLTPGQSA